MRTPRRWRLTGGGVLGDKCGPAGTYHPRLLPSSPRAAKASALAAMRPAALGELDERARGRGQAAGRAATTARPAFAAAAPTGERRSAGPAGPGTSGGGSRFPRRGPPARARARSRWPRARFVAGRRRGRRHRRRPRGWKSRAGRRSGPALRARPSPTGVGSAASGWSRLSATASSSADSSSRSSVSGGSVSSAKARSRLPSSSISVIRRAVPSWRPIST